MKHNFFEINKLISDKLESGEPFSLLRIDNTATYVITCLDKGEVPIQNFFNEYTLVEGGITPTKLDYAFSVVYPKTLEVMKECDILGFVDLSEETRKNEKFLGQFANKDLFFDYEILILNLIIDHLHIAENVLMNIKETVEKIKLK